MLFKHLKIEMIFFPLQGYMIGHQLTWLKKVVHCIDWMGEHYKIPELANSSKKNCQKTSSDEIALSYFFEILDPLESVPIN